MGKWEVCFFGVLYDSLNHRIIILHIISLSTLKMCVKKYVNVMNAEF